MYRLDSEIKKGLVVVLTGEGKGKTTSALGMTLRAIGHGMKICIIQFMKGRMYAGEWDGVKRLSPQVELYATGMGFYGIQGNPFAFDEHRTIAQDAVMMAREKILSGRWDIVILDEINNALALNLVDQDQVMGLIDMKPVSMHLILTGRDVHMSVIERADTVSEVVELKHAYRKGIEPQPGIDF